MLSKIKKCLTPSNYLDFALGPVRRLFPNFVVDHHIHSLEWEELTQNTDNCELSTFQISSKELHDWTTQYYPDYLLKFGELKHKKLIEFYTTFCILNPHEKHVFMDAAGGANGYLVNLNCKRKILQDIRISSSTREILGPCISYIELDAGSIPLPDESVDLISCHHSFEHFQFDSDINFVREIQRLLTVGGKCCIIPLFIANRYAEITSKLSFRFKFDQDSLRIIDPTATISGGRFSGYYARVYDISAFQRRIIQNIDLSRFKVSIYALKIDGELLPDMTLQCHKIVTAVNFPYRALVIHRTAP